MEAVSASPPPHPLFLFHTRCSFLQDLDYQSASPPVFLVLLENALYRFEFLKANLPELFHQMLLLKIQLGLFWRDGACMPSAPSRRFPWLFAQTALCPVMPSDTQQRPLSAFHGCHPDS